MQRFFLVVLLAGFVSPISGCSPTSVHQDDNVLSLMPPQDSKSWRSRSTFFQEDESFQTEVCAPDTNEVPLAIRNKCHVTTCRRKGNQKVCTSEGNPEISRLHQKIAEQDQARREVEKQNSRDQLRKKCFAGLMDTCIEWVHSEPAQDFDSLAKICQNKKTFKCSSRYEPLKVEEFDPKCSLSNGEMVCEEGFNKQYVVTRVKYLKGSTHP